MTIAEFFGCSFIAFGPPLALFIFTVAKDPMRVIVLMASAFFWLLSLLLSSLLWFAVVPLREHLAFGLVFSVLFQELFRFLFYLLLRKADEGLKKVSERDGSGGSVSLVQNKHLMAYVAGLGYGVIAGAFSLVNVLADSTGPGTVGLFGHSQYFFVSSAFLTLAFVLLHTFWGLLFHTGLARRRWLQVAAVVASHMLVSCVTLLNQRRPPVYAASLTVAWVSAAVCGAIAYLQAGGSPQSLRAFCCRR